MKKYGLSPRLLLLGGLSLLLAVLLLEARIDLYNLSTELTAASAAPAMHVKPPPPVFVPQLSGLSCLETRKLLAGAALELEVGRLEPTWYQGEPANCKFLIYSQDPEPGTHLGTHGKVTVWISDDYIKMPDLELMTLDETRQTLRQYGLKLEEVRSGNTQFPRELHRVICQEPPPGRAVHKSGEIRITIAEHIIVI
ncbi:MAG: PASTA domain-containing protein [Armatimonadia bacterium]